MPQTLTIAIFIFGAVLLLIGLLGGAFKLFGTEISGKAGAGGRVVASVLGVALIASGIVIELRRSERPTEPAERAVATDVAAPRAASVPAELVLPKKESMPPSEPARATAPINLSGTWKDETGTIYSIAQHGNAYTFDAFNKETKAAADGSGNLQGLEWESTFRTNFNTTGRGKGTLSSDGNQMTGRFEDSGLGAYTRILVRQR